MRIGLGLLIIGIILLAAGLGGYLTTPPSKGKLVLDWWYESSGHYPQSADQAVVYKTQLERSGLVTVNLHGADWASYKKYTAEGSMQVYVFGWWPDYVDSDMFLYGLFHSKGGAWLNDGYSDPQLDRLIDLERRTMDPTERGQYFSQAQALLAQDVPGVPVFQTKAYAVTKPGVTGVNLDITQNMYYWLISPPAGGDTLIVGTTDSIPSNLDPAEQWSYFVEQMQWNLGAPLVYIKPGSTGGPDDFTPALASDWSMSPDGLTWTFNLRQGLKFADGTEFTADAVKYSFDRSMGLATEEGPQTTYGYSDMIANIAAPSRYQAVLTLKFPVPSFLALMAFPGSFIVNPKYAPMDKVVQYVEGDPRASNPNDLGPYLLTEWVRKGGKDYEMRLDANPNYFGAAEGYPRAKHIVFKFYADSTSLAGATKAGDLDMAYRHLISADIKGMQSDPNLKVWEGVSATIQFILFNEHMPPLDNPEVRRAIAGAIDRNELCDTVFMGQAVPLYSMIPIGMPYYEPVFKSLGDGNISTLTTTLKGLGYTQETVNPTSQLWGVLGVIGAVVAIAGAASLIRKKST